MLCIFFVIFFSKIDDDTEINSISESERDLDAMVDMMLHERYTGNYFLKYLEEKGNKVCIIVFFSFIILISG